MAEKLNGKEIVSSEELLMTQMVQLDTISQLLIEKGIFTQEEFFAKLKKVRDEYITLRKGE